MEKLKDIVLIGFAVVGFISILSGFTEQQVYAIPESHVWEFHSEDEYSINKVTGEVRSYNWAVDGKSRGIGVREYTAKPMAYGTR